MRNIIFNTEQLQKSYTTQVIILVVWILILLSMIVSCSVLIFLSSDTNKFKTYSQYIAGSLVIAAILYAIIKIVWRLIAKK